MNKSDLMKMLVTKEGLSEAQAARIVDLISDRSGDALKMGEGDVSSSLRYKVLTAAKGRCMLCGATSSERLLNICHIKPVSRGGETIYENLQVLCEKCSTSRPEKEDSDFRPGADEGFNNDCIFCAASKENLLTENDYAFAIPDKYPSTEGHTLIIPKRHFASYFDSIQVEHDAIYELLKIREKQLLENDPLITGFDIGVNVGENAGQKVFHCHVHLIPRRKGDSPKWGERSKSK
jgi:diadenosine tetraphosphate (Ap4A) HIT family hydrolase